MPTLPTTMRALVKAEAKPGLSLVEAPVPKIGPRDVLIRVVKAGICGTDHHIYEWDAWASRRVKCGTIIGHEFMGYVVRVGSEVKGIAVGDRVSGEGHIGCGLCYSCRTGQGHICDHVDIIGIDVNGCFADYVLLPETNVWRLHPVISDEVGAMHDPLGNAMHTVMASDVSGRSVLVVGAGAIGLLIIHIAAAAGAADIVALDTNSAKLRWAVDFTAFNPRAPGIESELLERTRSGRGFDVMLEASGSPDGIRTGLRFLHRGGRAALLGIPHKDVTLNIADDVVFKGITIHGIKGRKMYETWYQVENFLLHRHLSPERIISHQMPFDRFEDAFSLIRGGEATKILPDLIPD